MEIETPRTSALIAEIVKNPGLDWTFDEVVQLGEHAMLLERELIESQAEIKTIKRRTLLEAASEVAGHWNERTTTTNQFEQAQRSAEVLRNQALAFETSSQTETAGPPSAPNLGQLREHVSKLKALLDDAQPGLAIWVRMYGEHMTAINDFWNEKTSGGEII